MKNGWSPKSQAPGGITPATLEERDCLGDNIAYIELTGKGGAHIHFVGKPKPLHLNTTEAEGLRDYFSGEQATDIIKAA